MVGVLVGISMLLFSIWSSMNLSTSTAQVLGRYRLQQALNQELRREVEQLALGTVKAQSFEALAALQNAAGYVDPAVIKGPAKEGVLTIEGQPYIVERSIQLKKWKNSKRDVDYVLVKVSLFEEKDQQKGRSFGAKTKVLTH